MNKVTNFIRNNDTNVIIGMGIASGLGLGSYIWFKTGQKCQNIIFQKEQELNRKLTFKEKVKSTWKMFIFPVVNTAVSAGSIIYATKVSNARYAALGAAYNLTEVAFQKYMDKTREVVGKNKEEEIKQAIAKDNDENSSDKNKVQIITTGREDIWIRDSLSGREFLSSWDRIQKAALELNLEAANDLSGKITVSDWYYKIGLDPTADSDDRGWDISRYGNSGKIDIEPVSYLRKNNEPGVEIYYNTRPMYFK